jgi:hypothetical protein
VLPYDGLVVPFKASLFKTEHDLTTDFGSCIVFSPTAAVQVDEDGDAIGTKMIYDDDGIREGTTLETLAKLKPAFKKGGTTTAGNSSQVSPSSIYHLPSALQ